jgi:hypothetical protein
MVGVLGAGFEFAKMAAEDAAEAENLANTLSSIPGVTDEVIKKNAEWIDSMERATLVSDSELRNALSKLALATGDVTKAQQLTKLAVDASTASGKSLTSVTDAMAKAAGGNTAALEKLFPFLKSNKEQLDKNKDGALSLKEAMDGLSKAYSGSAEAAANKKPWEQIRVVFTQIAEEVGEELLPYIYDLADWFLDPKNQDAVSDMVDSFVDMWKAVRDLANRVADVLGPLSKIVGILIDINDFMQRILDKGNPFKNFRQPELKSYPSADSYWAAAGGRRGSTRQAGGGGAPSVIYAAPPVYVTEEQVYRAVSRLLVRGEVRHGSSRLAVP